MRSSKRKTLPLRTGGSSPLPSLHVAADVIPYADGGEEPLFAHFANGDSDEYAPCSSSLPWPLFYHLTPVRKALLNWIDFGSNPLSILELGAGCGAITSYLVTVPGASVVALEGARRRAEIIQQRCRRAANLTIHAGNITRFQPQRRFDVVTLIGVLEYAGKYSPGEDPFRAVLDLASSWLTDTGCLILAIENRLGHKYLAGLPEDHYTRAFEGINGYLNYAGIRTFDRSSLAALLDRVGLGHQAWFYPFPDYKIPNVVLSDSGLDSPDFDSLTLLDLPTVDGSTQIRPALHERALLKGLRAQGSVAPFMNSFLVLASRSEQAPLLRANRDMLAVKTTLGSRGPLFQTKTTFSRDTDRAITVNRRRLHQRPVPPYATCRHAIAKGPEAYHVGMDNLLDALFDSLLANDGASLPVLLGHWKDALAERAVDASEEEQSAFKKFSSEHLGREIYSNAGSAWVPGDCLDLHPGNILIEAQTGKRVLIEDLEWRMQFRIPLQLVFDRGLYILANRLRRCATYVREVATSTADVPSAMARHLGGLDLFQRRDAAAHGLFEQWFQCGVITSDLSHRLAQSKPVPPDPLQAPWAAVCVDTSDVEAWGRFVTCAKQQGRLGQAFALCLDQLQSHPRDLSLLLAAASIARMAGDRDAAAACFERVLVVDPNNRNARNALASLQTFEQPEPWYAQASLLVGQKDVAAGMESLQGLLAKFPGFAVAHNDLGILLLQAGKGADGLRHLELAAGLAPQNVEILENLASTYGTLKRPVDQEKTAKSIAAIVADRGAEGRLESIPTLTAAGLMRLDSGCTRRDARASVIRERAALVKTWLALPPGEFRPAYDAELGQKYRRILGSGLQDEPLGVEEQQTLVALEEEEAGDPLSSARKQLAALLYRRPHLGASSSCLPSGPSWLLPDFTEFMLSPPPLFQKMGETERYCGWLETFIAQIHGLATGTSDGQLRSRISTSFALHENFIQAYFNERNLKQLYSHRSKLLSMALEGSGVPLGMTFAKREAVPSPIRLGLLVSHLAPSAETFAILPLIEHLGPDFSIFLYCLNSIPGEIEREAKKRCHRFGILGKAIAEQVSTIRRDDLDILFFGTNVTAVTNPATVLAVFRLARIQMTGPASVTTSGMPNMDYYVSGSLSDPSSKAASHYTEKLVRVSGAAQCFDYGTSAARRKPIPPRSLLGIPEGDVVFASAANMFKMTPEVLHHWARILSRCPGSRLLLLPFGPNWTNRYPKDLFVETLRRHLDNEGVSIRRVVLVDWPGLDRDDVRALLSVADIYLDAFPFSSTTSLVEPLEAGLPVVCREGSTFRSAMGPGILRELGMPELIADSAATYMDLAERLALQTGERLALKQRINAAMSRRPRFLDPAAYALAMAEVLRTVGRELRG